MVRIVYATFIILTVTVSVRTQFFDFFSGIQPFQQTLKPIFPLEATTKRAKTQTKSNKQESTTKRQTQFSYLAENWNTDEQKKKNTPLLYDFYSTTAKPARKTTKSNPSRINYDTNPNRDNTSVNNKVSTKEKNNSRNNGQSNKSNNARNSNARPQFHALQSTSRKTFNDDRLIFDDGRNTIISYETTKRPYALQDSYETKRTSRPNSYTTSIPYTIRPGVRPAVVNGPPITNRPQTQRSTLEPRPIQGLDSQDDTSLSPELIIGPNEDYMSIVEKKRYIEMAEKMCDKYKALDIKQIAAIPLVPSPDPYKVNVSTCTPNSSPLVIGGRVATIQEFRHMALLGWTNIQTGRYSWKCGGSLISNQYVLTAAHCAYQDRDNNLVTGAPRAVQLGSALLDDPGAVVVKVAAVIRHPKYKLPKSYYDIAIVKMANTVTFSSVIKPACLGIPPAPGTPVIATGWGKTEFGDGLSQELRAVSLPIWDITECNNILGPSRKLPEGPSSDSQICAGEKKGGKDTCQGDSGGPAQIQDGCSWRVVAVTSLGRSCGAPQTPAVYAKVPRAFVSSVAFGGKITNNNNQQNSQQNPNKTPQWNSQQQPNQKPNAQQQPTQWNNNQQQNTQQNANKNPQWNSQQQQTTQWNSNQQQNSQQNTNKNPQWNTQQLQNVQQQTAQWNSQQSNNRQNWNNQETTRNPQYWNRNQEASTRSPQWNSGEQSSSQRDYKQQAGSNNNVYQQNREISTQSNTQLSSNRDNRNRQSNNEYYTDNNYYNQNIGSSSNNRGRYNDQTTSRSVYNNQQNGYYKDDISEVVPSGYQSDDSQSYYSDGRVWWT